MTCCTILRASGRYGKWPQLARRFIPETINLPAMASSLLSVVLSRWFNSAPGGRCERKPDLVSTELPFEARLAAVPCRGGETTAHHGRMWPSTFQR